MEAFGEDEGSLGHAVALSVLLLGGFTLGSLGLGLLERWIRARGASLPPMAGGATDALTVEQSMAFTAEADVTRQALRTGLFIAAAIGLHNFAEGLAIGVSAGTGEIALATVLVVGFALHNATEGFGIVGPLGGVTTVLELVGVGWPDRRPAGRNRRQHRLQRGFRAARALRAPGLDTGVWVPHYVPIVRARADEQQRPTAAESSCA